MQVRKSRICALFGLLGFALLMLGMHSLPLTVPHLRAYRPWVKAAQARLRGAVFVGEAGVVLQVRGNDCGAACLKMILEAHGIERSLAELTHRLGTTSTGTSMLQLRLASAALGLPARAWAIREVDLRRAPLPLIAFVGGNHFVVIRRFVAPGTLEVDDPALGRLQWPVRTLHKIWSGTALIFDPAWSPS
jgi:ABC-type bacteriocin/lantibiotic exporter with double-glycine peptidase domain